MGLLTEKWSFSARAAVVAGLGGLVVGYDLGVISGALPMLRDRFGLTAREEGLVVAMSALGHLPGAPIGGYLSDRIGRKRTMILANALFIVAVLLLAASGSARLVILGRFAVGVAVAINVMSCVPWVSEVVPGSRRGSMTACYELFLASGVLASFAVYFVGVLAGEPAYWWRAMFSLSAALAVLHLCVVALFPESAAWLVSRGRLEAAREALRMPCGGDDGLVRAELDRLRKSCDRAAAAAGGPSRGRRLAALSAAGVGEMDADSEGGGWGGGGGGGGGGMGGDGDSGSTGRAEGADATLLGRSPAHSVRPWAGNLVVYCAIVCFGFLSGGINVRIYAPTILRDLGLDATAAAGVTVALGVVKVGVTAVSVARVDREGRRRLLLVGQCLTLLAAAVLVAGARAASEAARVGAGIAGCLLYTVAYQVSYGPVGFVGVEMFPPAIRARVLGLIDVVGNLVIGATAEAFPVVAREGGYAAAFGAHLVFAAAALLYTALYVVEMMDREPQQIREDLRERAEAVAAAGRALLAGLRKGSCAELLLLARGKLEGGHGHQRMEEGRRGRPARRGGGGSYDATLLHQESML